MLSIFTYDTVPRTSLGHFRVPRGLGKLGKYAMHMKSTLRRPKSKDKIDKLEAIGFFDSLGETLYDYGVIFLSRYALLS